MSKVIKRRKEFQIRKNRVAIYNGNLQSDLECKSQCCSLAINQHLYFNLLSDKTQSEFQYFTRGIQENKQYLFQGNTNLYQGIKEGRLCIPVSNKQAYRKGSNTHTHTPQTHTTQTHTYTTATVKNNNSHPHYPQHTFLA